uniref:Uncharacterized protein n=1 Tax=Rhizophora mucronata TaxID=61149 RepID=A0A2P2JHZ0_RHIMU
MRTYKSHLPQPYPRIYKLIFVDDQIKSLDYLP